MRFKKFKALALSLAMTLSMAACGSGGTGMTSAGTTSSGDSGTTKVAQIRENLQAKSRRTERMFLSLQRTK